MKQLITILLIIISGVAFGQNKTGKQYIPWLKSDAITITGAGGVENPGYFIWHGDTIDFNVLSDSTIVFEADSTVLFVTLKQLVDSLNSLPGGHSPATIGAAGTTAGLSITGQEINMQSATASRNGYLTSPNFTNFNNKLTIVTHNNTLTGDGTVANPLKADTAIMAARQWVLNQNYIEDVYLNYDSLAGTPTIPVIENNPYDITWDNDLDGTSKNTIYDVISALPGGHNAVTLSSGATLGGLSLSTQELGFQPATASDNGYLKNVDYIRFNKDTSATNEIQYLDTARITSDILQLSLFGDGKPMTNIGMGSYVEFGDTLTKIASQYDLTQINVFANNGLTMSGETVQLGGVLTKDSTIIGGTGYYDGSVNIEIIDADTSVVQEWKDVTRVAENTSYSLGNGNGVHSGRTTSSYKGTDDIYSTMYDWVDAQDNYGNYYEIIERKNIAVENTDSIVKSIQYMVDGNITTSSWRGTAYMGIIGDKDSVNLYLYRYKYIDQNKDIKIGLPVPTKEAEFATLPISVNGVKADTLGNISITQEDIAGICDQTVQTLSGSTDTLNVANGVNGYLDISGNTTIRIEPTANCNTGNITVLTDATGYTLTFVGGTMKISPYLDSTAGVITTSAAANGIDVYSWYYDGTRIIINGTKGYE